MKIVVLDGYCKNHGEISWSELEELGEVKIYDRTNESQVIERIYDADIVWSNKVRITNEVLERCPKLKFICIPATGVDHVDICAAKRRGIIVSNIPEYGEFSVAQHVFALLLEITNAVAIHNQSVASGDWCNSSDFCYWKTELYELKGKKISVIGKNCKAERICCIAAAFGMHANIVDISGKYIDNTLFINSDVIVLNCDLTTASRHLISESRLNEMKSNTIIINVSRGELIDEKALTDALNKGKIYYAGLDAVTDEPMQANCPLLNAKNCIITPHIAGCTLESRHKIMKIALENIRGFLCGKPRNIV